MKKVVYGLFAAVLVIAISLKVSAQDVSEQTRDVSGYSSISIAGPFKTRIILGNTESVKLKVDAQYIDKVETVVESGTLMVRLKRPGLGWKKENYNMRVAEVVVYVKTLGAVTNAGSGNTSVEGNINSSDFKATLSGAGAINLPAVKASNALTLRLSGSGSINISGSSPSVGAFISGSGEIKAKDFSTKEASITISGSGNVYIKAENTLTATLVGAGNVYYSGNAQVTKHKVGSGSVNKVE